MAGAKSSLKILIILWLFAKIQFLKNLTRHLFPHFSTKITYFHFFFLNEKQYGIFYILQALMFSLNTDFHNYFYCTKI